MPVPASQRRRVGLLAASLLAAAIGCKPATHVVGRVRAESDIERPSDGPSAAGSAGHEDTQQPQAGQGGDSDNQSSGQPRDAGSSGAGGSITGGGPAGSAAVPPPIGMEPDFDCGAAPVLATRKQLDVYLMVDSNFNLPIVGTNPAMVLRETVGAYAQDERAAGTGLAIDYFSFDRNLLSVLTPTPTSQPELCSDGKYAAPAVPMARLPQNAVAIENSFDTVDGINASDMLPALTGALRYSKSLTFLAPDTKKVVVLFTDGFIDLTCGSDENSLRNAARAGVQQAPSVPTYLIALDAPDLSDLINPLTGSDPLDAIAVGGGTGHARHVAQNDLGSFVDAMLEVQHDAEPCEFSVPQFERDDPGRLSFGLDTPIGVPPVALTPVTDAASCGEGYYYDQAHQWLTLCRSTCDAVKAQTARLIWFTDC